MTARPVDVMFLSPHLDDVALSCAGTLRDHARRSATTLVVTVFGGPPAPDVAVGPLQQAIVGRASATRDDLEQLWAQRIAEDEAAMAVLDTEAVRLAWPEAAFRAGVTRPRQLWEAVVGAALERTVHGAVLALWHERARPVVCAPLAVGGHVDHLLCYRVARALRRSGANVVHYEDFPYAARPGLLDARLAEVARDVELVPHVVATSQFVAAQVEAVRCYRSQVAGLFGAESRIEAVLARSVAARGGERLWQARADARDSV